MAAANVGGAILGDVFGEVLNVVINAINNAYIFNLELEDLKSTLESIALTVQEIENFNGVLDIPELETAKLRKEMIKGKKLVRRSSKVQPFNFFNRVHYSEKIIKLKKSIETFYNVNIQTQVARDSKRILVGVNSIKEILSVNEKCVGESNRVEIDGPCSVPDSLASTPGLDVPMKELRTELLKDDGMQVIVVSAPGGAGKTTLIKTLCKDDQVKGAAIPSPSSRIPEVPAKPESLPMKCQWQKGKRIGRGTFGSVYVARNRETGALCAMKEVEMFPDDPKSAECIKQLEQEIKVLSNMKHPNIVHYYGSEIVEDKFYIYLEYVPPGSINKYVREHCGALTESIIRNFTRHILSGLAYLHSKRTVHRDIKGANLLVDVSGVVKLADFGVAKHLTGQAAELSLKGSPYWIAPELIMQRDYNSDLALAVDIWSLGCTFIEMYTGKPPWSEFEGPAAMFKVMNDTPSIPESLSAEAKDFLRCCFQRNPADRPLASKLLEHRFLKNSQQQPDVP